MVLDLGKIPTFSRFFCSRHPLPACFCALCSTMITTLISNQSRIDFTFTSTCHRNFCSFWHQEQASWQQLKTTVVWWTEHHYCNNWYISTSKSFDGSEQVGWQQLTSRNQKSEIRNQKSEIEISRWVGNSWQADVRSRLLMENLSPAITWNMKSGYTIIYTSINKSKLLLLLKNINIIFEIKQLRWLSIIFN